MDVAVVAVIIAATVAVLTVARPLIRDTKRGRREAERNARQVQEKDDQARRDRMVAELKRIEQGQAAVPSTADSFYIAYVRAHWLFRQLGELTGRDPRSIAREYQIRPPAELEVAHAIFLSGKDLRIRSDPGRIW